MRSRSSESGKSLGSHARLESSHVTPTRIRHLNVCKQRYGDGDVNDFDDDDHDDEDDDADVIMYV